LLFAFFYSNFLPTLFFFSHNDPPSLPSSSQQPTQTLITRLQSIKPTVQIRIPHIVLLVTHLVMITHLHMITSFPLSIQILTRLAEDLFTTFQYYSGLPQPTPPHMSKPLPRRLVNFWIQL
jgi:hypothetical protein